jgi:hypothetical protein
VYNFRNRPGRLAKASLFLGYRPNIEFQPSWCESTQGEAMWQIRDPNRITKSHDSGIPFFATLGIGNILVGCRLQEYSRTA